MIFSKWAGKIYFMFSHIWYIYIYIYLFCRWWFHAGQREHNTGRPSQLSILISSSSAPSSSSLCEWAGSRMEDQDEGSEPVMRIRIHHNGNRITDRDERCITTSRNSNLISKNVLKDSEFIKGCSWKLWLISSSKFCHHKLNNLVKLLPCQSLEWICELRYWEHFSIIPFCWKLYPVLLQIFQNLGIWHLLGLNF